MLISGDTSTLRGTRLPRWVAPVAVGVVVLAGCVALAVADPARRAELSPGCPFRTLTGLDCPGCGGTRAVYALLQGDPARAVDHNVLTLLLLPVLVWGWVGWLAATLGWRRDTPQIRPRLAWMIAGSVVVFWIARNLAWTSWLGSTASWSLGG